MIESSNVQLYRLVIKKINQIISNVVLKVNPALIGHQNQIEPQSMDAFYPNIVVSRVSNGMVHQ